VKQYNILKVQDSLGKVHAPHWIHHLRWCVVLSKCV